MVKTRSMRKMKLSAKRSYRRRVKSSACRGKKGYLCAAKPGCKMTKGKKRSFCRKSTNTRRHKK
jgi:hypothetical protein